MIRFSRIATLSFLLVFSSAFAQDSGFLTDYSNLTSNTDTGFSRAFVAPGALDKIARFNQVMVDQPSIIIAADSKYKGAKAQDMAEIAEALRSAMTEALSQSIPVVEEPGDGAALISWAVSNVYLKKAKRGVLSYTPVGAVAFGAKKLASDAIDKTRSYDVVIEVEATDSVTGEVFFAMVVDLAEAGEEVQFESGLVMAHGLGLRIGCRLKNAGLAVDQREDCLAIPVR